MEQEPQLFRILFIHHEELVIQNALNAVVGTVNLGDLLSVKRCTDHTVGAGVDHRGRTAGLAKDAGADKFLAHGKMPPSS